jgi:NDP-sugar pyrophosphorylase family protein
VFSFNINAGIYVFSPDALKSIPRDCNFDTPDLVNQLIATGHNPGTFPISGYWQDIGRKSDLEKAKQDIRQGLHERPEVGE